MNTSRGCTSISLNGPLIGFAYSPGGAIFDAFGVIVNTCPCSMLDVTPFTLSDINIELSVAKTVTVDLKHSL